MDKNYACYCGLYCENCAVKLKVHPAAKTLYDEMTKAGFAQVVGDIPGGEGFWDFLKSIAENWICTSCREGSGNRDCAIRVCAEEKGVEMCALCGDYPCGKFEVFDGAHAELEGDNALLRDEGWEAWGRLQDERQASGFIYAQE